MFLLTLGDSITLGTGGTGDVGWNQLVAAALTAAGWPATTLINLGTGSEMASGGVTHLPEITNRYRDLFAVTIAYGMNDLPAAPQSMTLADFEAALLAIGEAMIPLAAHVFFLNIYPNTIGDDAPGTAEYNAVIADVAAQLDLPLIDVSQAYPPDTFEYCDGVHPTDAGYAILAQLVLDALTRCPTFRRQVAVPRATRT